jgi:DNA-binding XRE family transcriptional regulator
MPKRDVQMNSATIGLLKAARGVLHWSQEDLAGKSGVSLSTIKKLERRAYRKNKVDDRYPHDSFFSTHEVVDAILSAFRAAGVNIEAKGSETHVVVDRCMGTADFLRIATHMLDDKEDVQS